MEKLPKLALSMVDFGLLWMFTKCLTKCPPAEGLSVIGWRRCLLCGVSQPFPSCSRTFHGAHEQRGQGDGDGVSALVNNAINQHPPMAPLRCPIYQNRQSTPALTRYHISGTGRPPRGRLILSEPYLHEGQWFHVLDWIFALNLGLDLFNVSLIAMYSYNRTSSQRTHVYTYRCKARGKCLQGPQVFP